MTDTWFRPDLRAYEYGDVELAIQEKKRLEENQWIWEKERVRNNIEYKPKWFDFKVNDGEVVLCEYTNKYWEQKITDLEREKTINIY